MFSAIKRPYGHDFLVFFAELFHVFKYNKRSHEGSEPMQQIRKIKQNKKPKRIARLLICNNFMAGERELFQTPDEEVKCDVEQIRELLKEAESNEDN